ncbi:MAG: fibronectin type III domain-containing protein [Candidatus Eisenbacteria bacterium]
MPDTATSFDFRAAAVWVAAVSSLIVLSVANPAFGAGPRAVSSHVVIGLTENAGFTVMVNGDEIPGSPVVSSDLGILSFDVDDSGFPGGPRTVVIGDPGELVISNVHVDGVTQSSAVVHWSTNLPSNSSVQYGPTASYGQTSPTDPVLVMTHAVTLSGLDSGATYHFSVSSDDGQGHSSSSPDGTFTTGTDLLDITGARIDSVGETWAVVAWETNRPADSRVEYGTTTAYGSSTTLDTSLVLSHRVTVSGLAPGTTYHVRAHSDDEFGPPAVSEDHQFATDQIPLSVGDVDVTWLDATGATIVWTTNRPADSRVEYGTTASYGSTTETHDTPVTEHEVTLGDLEPGTLYHFRVWSAAVGDPVASGDGTFTTEFLPLSLTDFTVEQIGQTWAILSWLTDRPATTHVVYGETEDFGSVESPGPGFVSEHSTTLSGLAAGALYYFRVVSVDQDLIFATLDSTLVTLEGEATGPPQMDGVGCDPCSATSVVVCWTTDRPATSQVRYGTNGELDCETVADPIEVTEHAVVLWPVVPRSLYTFVAVSSCGSDTTVCAPLTFRIAPPPAETPDVRPVDIIKIITITDETSAVVTWASDRPCSSWVEYGESADYGQTMPGIPLGEAAYTAQLDGLASGLTYHFRVCAWDRAGGEVSGDDVTFETSLPPDEVPPRRPTGLACELREGGVEVTWDENSEPDLLGYNVYRARARDSTIDWSRAEILNQDPIGEPGFLDTCVEAGALYAYAVTAVDDSGNESELSESADVFVDADELGSMRFALYPNPVRDDATFVFTLPPGVASARLRIISTSGRVVLERSVSQAERGSGEHVMTWDARDPSGWPVGEGVYLCEFRAGDHVTRTKLTVLH